MSVHQDERTPGAFRTVADLDVETFSALCEREVDADVLPTASEVVRKVPVYTAAALRSAAATDRRAIMAELNGCILDGPGALAVRDAIDPAIVDAASAVYRELIDEEAAAGRSAGDHFAAPGKNERLWNSFQKLAERAPSAFVAYFANPVLDLVCESWLGPGYRMTAQVNVVHPGGDAQRPHRDYHLGFLSDDEAARYPLPMHRASALLTLQGRGRPLRHGRRVRPHPPAALLAVLRPRVPRLPGPGVRGLLHRPLRAAPTATRGHAVLQSGAVPRRR